MRTKLQDAFICLAISNTYFLDEWLNFITVTTTASSSVEVPLRFLNSCFAMIFVVFLGASLSWGLLTFVRYTKNERALTVAHLFLFCLLAFPIKALIQVLEAAVVRKLPESSSASFLVYSSHNLKINVIVLFFLFIAVVLVRKGPRFISYFRLGLLAIFPLVILTFFHTFRIGISLYNKPDRPRPSQMPLASNRNSVRVVWMIFDELDQRLAFSERPGALKLPAFDELQKESLSATNAYPPGKETMESIPALLTGRQIVSRPQIIGNDFKFSLNDQKEPVLWSQIDNVFSRARAIGVRSWLTGWHLPYCAALGKSIDRCKYHSRSHFDYSKSFSKDVSRILKRSLLQFRSTTIHVDDFERVREEAKEGSIDPAVGLVFLHLPVPHNPWIYDQENRRLSIIKTQEPGGYFDNLALADRLLYELRSSMEEAGVWNSSVVIVSSDHSWRDSKTWDGIRDTRIPFLVKMPDGQQVVYKEEMNSLLTQKMILSVLKGELKSTKELSIWLDKNKLPVPSDLKETTHYN